MDTEFDKFLVELKIINNIPINGKLIIENNCLIIDNNTFLSTIYRKWYRHSRKDTISHLNILYSSVFSMIDKYLDSHLLKPNFKIDAKDYLVFYDMKNKLIYLKDALFSSKIGIKNLIGTYNDDNNMVKDLSSLIIKINDYYEKVSICIQSNNNKSIIKN